MLTARHSSSRASSELCNACSRMVTSESAFGVLADWAAFFDLRVAASPFDMASVR